MMINLEKLPDNLEDALQIIKYKKIEIDYLKDRVRLLEKEIFGRKSEKIKINIPNNQVQGLLFPGEEKGHPPVPPTPEIVIPEHTRRKSGRKPLPKHFPRIEEIYDIPEEEKICACGCQMVRIGEDVCEKLDYVPAVIRVIRQIRPKYACRACEGTEDDGPTVKIAPPPPQLIPKSYATAGLLAYLVVSKYVDGLPLYRLEKIFKRLNIDLPRSTMAAWLMKLAQCFQQLFPFLENEIRSGPVINVDETTIQVLNESGRKNTTKSYMWVYIGGQPDRPVVVYQYHETRSGGVALEFLKGYQGYVQSDAYAGYEKLANEKGIIRLGCWAHARRAFVNVVNAGKQGTQPEKTGSGGGLANEALNYIRTLYRVEKEARENGASIDDIYKMRQTQSIPLLDSFKTWLDAKVDLTPPRSLLGKAIRYTLSNWDKLTVFTQDGRLKPDNNVAENAIRPFVVGRKNWLFAGHPNGAHAAAIFFSLIETAKANGLEPNAYLQFLCKKMVSASSDDDYRSLLPQYVDPQQLKSF